MPDRAELMRLARLGVSEIAARAKAGTLPPGARMLALKGAGAFVSAIASGDIADDATYEGRLGVCARCPNRVDETAPGADGPSSWCGRAFQPNDGGDGGPVTCGCLLLVKCLVKSEACPEHRW